MKSIQAIASLSFTLVGLSSSTKTGLRKQQHRQLQLQIDEKDFGFEEARIVNGQDASPGQFPYFGRWGGCGASLISSDFMLSAAHCNVQENNDIRLGAYEYEGDGQYVNIKQRYRHPNNNNNEVVWDYLLLQLETPVTSVTPVPLNSESNIPATDEVLTVFGLGRVNYDPGDKPSRLQVVNVQTHSTDYCVTAYGSFDEDVMLCAGDEVYDSCVGDSGGPIITAATGQQVGIVSFGDGCAKQGKPGVYSRVSHVLPWIQETICANSADPPSFCTTQAVTEQQTPAPTANPTLSPTTLPTASPTIASTPYPTQAGPPAPTQSPLSNTTLTLTPVATPVPEANPAPSISPVSAVNTSCGDSTAPYPLLSAPAIESCEWLADRLDGYAFLCDIYNVAMTCQETCGICDLIAQFSR
jgi:V8-like Glu-specific endopeptidase